MIIPSSNLRTYNGTNFVCFKMFLPNLLGIFEKKGIKMVQIGSFFSKIINEKQ